ncbi:hypothetical protein SLEP1_g38588 [Rubroshorea leprosula]|uniref:Uncharacterized protein n=1 Tax=Rubroshorea leprosula TaxID=152421 RepID=A0AAV5KXI8_9ROSI|nr:hypothetical protein SLEP1_g38588 [Rubroshorea leprosula]
MQLILMLRIETMPIVLKKILILKPNQTEVKRPRKMYMMSCEAKAP